jgi:hypothetical protein
VHSIFVLSHNILLSLHFLHFLIPSLSSCCSLCKINYYC